MYFQTIFSRLHMWEYSILLRVQGHTAALEHTGLKFSLEMFITVWVSVCYNRSLCLCMCHLRFPDKLYSVNRNKTQFVYSLKLVKLLSLNCRSSCCFIWFVNGCLLSSVASASNPIKIPYRF